MFPVFGSPQELATQTASSSHSRGGAGAQWVTPPGEQSSESDELTPRFRSLSNLYDTTEEIQNFEYSGLCLLAADEPPSVEEALEEECWRKAMEAELQSIEENKGWDWSSYCNSQDRPEFFVTEF